MRDRLKKALPDDALIPERLDPGLERCSHDTLDGAIRGAWR
jgi:hypothetical protein